MAYVFQMPADMQQDRYNYCSAAKTYAMNVPCEISICSTKHLWILDVAIGPTSRSLFHLLHSEIAMDC